MKEQNNTKPRTLSGCMELLPCEQIKLNEMIETIKTSYETFGFLPLDTPILELSEVLLAKAGGETEKQIYRFSKGDTDLCLRFDLTVPLAKYVAMHYGELSFPFRRYQIGKVYRGERPQKGRFREFYQCDIDIIGDDELNILHDAEIPSIIYNTFCALGFKDFTIRINNRKILTGFFNFLKISEKSIDVMRILDKIEKIGKQSVLEELMKLELSSEVCDQILRFVSIIGSSDEKLEALSCMDIQDETFKQGFDELKDVVKHIRLFGVPDQNFTIDFTIARGLDYYTGTIYETFFNDHPELGSVCSGGRYENLASFYTNKHLPGVGISIGITRLFDQLCNLNIIKTTKNSIADVLVVSMSSDIAPCLPIANALRNVGICTEVYMDDKKIKTKFKYADKLKIPYVIVLGDSEIENNVLSLKNMVTGEQKTLSLEDTIQVIQNSI